MAASLLKAQVFSGLHHPDSLRLNFDELALAKMVHFKLVDAGTSEPVQLAHIVNHRKRLGVISDMLGYFNIPVSFGDSLTITALGYYTRTVLCVGQYSPDTLYHRIVLTPRVYKIDEVKVVRFSTYERFLKSVINLRLPTTQQDLSQRRMDNYMRNMERSIGLLSLPPATGGVMFGEDWYVGQKKKIDEARVKERKQDVIYKKYSHGLIESVTGLKGDSLLKFIAYLDFKENFLLHATEYDLRVAILEKFRTFKEHGSCAVASADSVSVRQQ